MTGNGGRAGSAWQPVDGQPAGGGSSGAIAPGFDFQTGGMRIAVDTEDSSGAERVSR